MLVIDMAIMCPYRVDVEKRIYVEEIHCLDSETASLREPGSLRCEMGEKEDDRLASRSLQES